MQLERKNILDMESLSVDEINMILDTADSMKEISQRPVKKVPTLRGKTVVLFFYEPSTRTRTSFDIAAKRLSADSLSISASSSSMVKGETLIDTASNLSVFNEYIGYTIKVAGINNSSTLNQYLHFAYLLLQDIKGPCEQQHRL